MPTPNLFKISSKSNKLSENSPSDVPPNAEENSVSQNLTGTFDSPIPGQSDIYKEVWMLAYQEPSQAKGAEKLLNKIGMSIIPVLPAAIIQR